MKRLVLIAVCGVLLGPACSEAAAGSVAGTVTPLEWAQEVEVCVAETQPSEMCAVPEPDGSYLLDELPLGPARIEFLPSYRSRLNKQYYNHKTTLAEAATIVLTQAAPHATNIDGDLVEGGAIEGRASAQMTAEPLPEVEVCAVSVGASGVRRCTETAAGGEYELHSLPTGSYRVGFFGAGRSADFQPWYYLGKSSLAEATPVSVTAGAAVTGIDAALAPGGRIEGTVTDAAGAAVLENVTVCLFVSSAREPDRCTDSSEAGAFAFWGLPDGSYQVGFSLEASEAGGLDLGGEGDGFAAQWFAEAPVRSQATAIGLVAPQTVAGIDAALRPPSSPPPPPPAVPVANSIVPAATQIFEPKPKPKACKKPKRRKKVKGKVRCVKPPKKHRHHRKAR